MTAKATSHKDWDEYILWLATPAKERGEIRTEEQWAKAHGYAGSRILRTWKANEHFIERQRRLAEGLASKSDAVVTFSDDADPDYGDERDYRLVKAQLLSSAKGGNLKATELFMKLYGKTWIDEEAASRSSDFSNQDLETLVATAILALSPELLAASLEDAGWTVKAPDACTPRFQ